MKTNTVTRMTIGAALGGALLFGGVATANAAPTDGRIDVALGSAGVLKDVPLAAAAQLAADVCDTDISQLTPGAESVDVSGTQQNVCSSTLGAVDFLQNGIPATPQGVTEQPVTAEGTAFTEEPGTTDETVTDEPNSEETDTSTTGPMTTTTTTTTAPAETPGN